MRLQQIHITSKKWFSPAMDYTISRAFNAES